MTPVQQNKFIQCLSHIRTNTFKMHANILERYLLQVNKYWPIEVHNIVEELVRNSCDKKYPD